MLFPGGEPIPQDQKQELLRQQAEANPAQVHAGETAVPHTAEIDVDFEATPVVEIPLQHKAAPLTTNEK
jgi:hypothetical protein